MVQDWLVDETASHDATYMDREELSGAAGCCTAPLTPGAPPSRGRNCDTPATTSATPTSLTSLPPSTILRPGPQRGVSVRNSARAASLNAFNGSIPFPSLTCWCSSSAVMFGSK